MAEIKCYCDASFDPKSKIAIAGWKIGDDVIRDIMINNTTNTRAEIIALVKLINDLNPNQKYIIYTDCLGIINRLASKDKLIKKNFSNNRGVKLSNADLYQKMFEIVSENIKILHIDGHIATKLMNQDNMRFSELDKHVRSVLRSMVKDK